MSKKVFGAVLLVCIGVLAILAYKLALQYLNPGPEPVADSGAEQSASDSGPDPGTIVISMASSNTKEEWLAKVTAAFNQASPGNPELQVESRPIRVEIIKETVDGKQKDYRSGTMIADTLSGRIKPTILSPGSRSWIEKFNKEWRVHHNSSPITGVSPVIVKTPIVIAMWRSRARALGCLTGPENQCTWDKIRKLAKNPNGWESVNRPEWGRFTFGYGAFGESNSGTMGVLSMCMVGAGKQTGLSMDDVEVEKGCGQFMADLETAKVHSGKSDKWLLERMVSGGQNYLDAVITYESNVIAMNRNHGADLPEPLVAVYPMDGAIFVSHPFAILDKADWVTPEQALAAKKFQAFLLDKPQQEAVLEMGLRPVDDAIALSTPVSEEFGADPLARPKVLEPPEPLVMDRLGEVWRGIKKKAVVVIAFDKSGSMKDGNKIAAARSGAREFVKLMGDEDILIWLPFDGIVYQARTKGPKHQVGEELIDEINAISAGGETALYFAILQARQLLEEYRQTYGHFVRYGLVVLSDGQDTTKGGSLAKVEAALMPQEHDPEGIQIHTVCIGEDCDEAVLRKISKAAHGRFWKGHTQNEMIKIYATIATHY